MTTAARCILVLFLLAGLTVLGGIAQPVATSAEQSRAKDSASTIPLSSVSAERISLAFLIGHGAGWRAAPEWHAVWAAAATIDPFASRLPAWNELARSMDLEPTTCFDSLLGIRAGLVIDPAGAWTAVSDISEPAVASLESALKTAPRGFEQGQRVSLIDRGRFSLTKLLASDGKGPARISLNDSKSAPEPERVTDALAGLDAIVRSVARDSVLGSAGFSWSGKDARGEPMRMAAGAARRGQMIEVRCAADPALFDLDQASAVALASGKPEFASFADTVLFGFRGRLPAPVRPAMGDTANAVRAAMALMKSPLPDPGVFGQELVLEIDRPTEGIFSLTVGLSVLDSTRAAEHADRLVTAVLEAASRAAGAPGGVLKLGEFDAKTPRDPLAIRMVGFDGAGDRTPTTYTWACFAGDAGIDAVRPGWFLFHMRAGDASRDLAERELRRHAARALLGSNTVMSVVIRPSAAARGLDAEALKDLVAVGGLGAWIELAKTIECIDARLVATPSGVVEGTGTIVAKSR